MSYTSYEVGKRPKRVKQCRADRMESARRFRALLSELGLKKEQAAQTLHVSLRTLHNWSSGVHEVPYCVVRLLRLERHLELPGAWSGWRFTRGHLVTPEGRSIAAHEGSWWSLMVQRGRSFDKLAERLRAAEDRAKHALHASSAAPCYSELCPQKSALQKTAALANRPVGNTGGTLFTLPQGEKLKGAFHG